jgi:YesN/AraC family two-component response regulator
MTRPFSRSLVECVSIDAQSGSEALGLIALELDIVIADFAMPEMNGLELAITTC